MSTGDRRRLERAVLWVRLGEIDYDELEWPDEGCYETGVITILNRDDWSSSGYPVGKVDADAGRAAVDYEFTAGDLAMTNDVVAVDIAPLNKGGNARSRFLLRLTHGTSCRPNPSGAG